MTEINRRKFIAGLAAAGAGTCLCGAGGCATFSKVGQTPAIAPGAYVVEGGTLTVSLDKVSELGAIGGAVKIIDPRLPQPLIVGRFAEAEYVAVSLLCPHRGVELEYRPKDGQFRCASLGHSTFGADGVRKSGPARRSLRKFAVKLNRDGQANVLQIALL